MFNVSRKNVFFKKRLHHFFKIEFPFGAVWFCFVFMLIPRMQVGKFVDSGYQEGVLVKIVINGNAVPFPEVRWPVIAKFAIAVS